MSAPGWTWSARTAIGRVERITLALGAPECDGRARWLEALETARSGAPARMAWVEWTIRHAIAKWARRWLMRGVRRLDRFEYPGWSAASIKQDRAWRKRASARRWSEWNGARWAPVGEKGDVL